MGEFYDDELREMDSDFLGIDTLTDIVYDPDYEILLVLNHISLERIFNYRDEFLNIANAAIDWTLAFKKSAVRSTEWKTVSESIR